LYEKKSALGNIIQFSVQNSVFRVEKQWNLRYYCAMTDPNQEPMVSQPMYAQVHELNLNDTPSPMPDNSGMKGTGNMKHMNKLFLLLIGAVVLAGLGTGTGLQQLTTKTAS